MDTGIARVFNVAQRSTLMILIKCIAFSGCLTAILYKPAPGFHLFIRARIRTRKASQLSKDKVEFAGKSCTLGGKNECQRVQMRLCARQIAQAVTIPL